MLNDKKTYIIAGAGIVIELLRFFGVLDDETANRLQGVLGFGGLMTLRQAVGKAQKVCEPPPPPPSPPLP